MNTRTTEAGALKAIGYVSRAAAPVDSYGLVDLEDEARLNNRAAGITGLLVFDAGYYVQILEGPEHAVDATLARIRRDSRHDDIEQVLDTPIVRRSFDRWALASIDLRAPAASIEIGDLAEDLASFLERVEVSREGMGELLLNAFEQVLALREKRSGDGGHRA